MLIEKTGCRPNCIVYRYNVRKVVEWDSVHYYGFGKIQLPLKVICQTLISGFWLSWIDGEITQETEKYEYDWLTLVANLGGLLGLFIGFSLLMLLDLVWELYTWCKTTIKNLQ